MKLFGPMNATPASTNITPGVAANLTTTINLSGNGSGSTGFKGPATFALSVLPAEPTITLSISNNPVVLATASSTTNAVLTVTTTALTPSNTYLVTIVADTNPPNASLVTPTNCTFTITMSTAAPFNPVKVWTNGGINGNWSTSGNWTPSGAPGSSNDVKFFDPGAVGTPGTVDNTMDVNFSLGSLTYGQSNNFHTTQIAAGTTLSILGTNGLAAGTGTDNGDSFTTMNTIKGVGGTLVVSNSSANISVGQSHPTTGTAVAQSQATLDVSGLDTFSATVARVLVGADVVIKGASGILDLAKTNKISTSGSTAPQIDVGDNSQSQGSPAIPSILLLGQTNAFFADSISVGRGKTDGAGSSMLFNSSFANPVAYFRGTNGTGSRVGTWTIGDGFGSRNNFPNDCHGSNDFSLGTINALVSTMFVGKGASADNGSGANVTGTGTLTFNAGTIDVDTLEVGYALTAVGSGTMNVNGGSLTVNTNLELAHGVGSSGTLNVSSATVNANNGITGGGGTSTIGLTSSTLNATNATATVGTEPSPLTTLAVTNSTLKLAAQSLTPAVTVTTLSCGGANNPLSFSSVPLIPSLPAQFPIIQYSTPDGNLATFTLGTLPSASPAYQGYISNNVANSSLDLVITNGPIVYPLIWVGSPNGNWDVNTTANWKTNGVATKYQQGYLVVQLDDSLTGTNTVNLTTTLTPGTVTVNNSLSNYTFVGTGKLSGTASLVKDGTAKLTLAESGGDDFTKGVTVLGGTLQVGNGGTSGSLPSGKVSVDTGAILAFNRSDNLTVASTISGLGILRQSGASILALNGSNTVFSGDIIAASGTLQAGNAAALGTASATVTVSNAATLDVNGQAFNNNQPITAVGVGVGGNGAIVNNNSNQTKVLRNVTLSGSTTFGGGFDWDIHSSANGASDASLSGNNGTYKLTKVGTNTVTIFGASVDGNLGDIDVQAGALSFERNTTSMGDSTKTATVFTNATLQLQNASNIWDKIVVLKDGGTLRGVNLDEFTGPVTLESGLGTLLAGSGGQLILDGVVSGAGSLSKNGSGTVTLINANTYSGSTLVNAGTLALGASASIGNSTNITILSGATVDVSARGDQTLALASGHSLQGSGTVIGNVTIPNGSTLVVGSPGTTNSLGTLTVTNTLTLQSGSVTLMEVSKVGTNKVNDQVVTTNVSYAGALTVTGAGGAFAVGDIFKLFSAGSYGGSFSTLNMPVGMTWDTSKLTVDGTIKVLTVSRPQFTAITRTNGAFQLSFSGPAGNSYRVWANTNVAATPITNTWTLLVTNGLFAANGTATFFDTGSSNLPARFYLISIP